MTDFRQAGEDLLATSYGRRKPAASVTDSPVDHCLDDRSEIFAFGGQLIVDARRVFAVADGFDDARPLEAFQAIGKRVGRNAFLRFDELREAMLATHQVANHQQRPAVAEYVERP